MKAQHFHTKLSCQKLMLIQIERPIQNEPKSTKNGLLPSTTSFFQKFDLTIRISYKYILDLIYPNYPNMRILTFRKRFIFIQRCIFL